MRILGRALVAVGLLVTVLGVRLLQLFTGIAENRTGLDTFGAFLIGLVYTALFAAPGIVIALVGWGLLRRDRPATERPGRQGRGLKLVCASAVLVVWAGVALSISTTHNGGSAPPPKPRSLAQQRADQATAERRNAVDRSAHVVPAAELRRTERKLATRLRARGVRSSDIRCERTWGWNVSCHAYVTVDTRPATELYLSGDYLPQSRMVLIDDQLPGTEP